MALAYLITFRTYGTWLPGDSRGSIERDSNQPAMPPRPPDQKLEAFNRRLMVQPAVLLDDEDRTIVSHTLAEVCRHRGWRLLASNVRTNHVHVLVEAECSPEHVMNALKAWSTRRLVEAGRRGAGSRTWVRHGSTRYLWHRNAVEQARTYVVEGQGLPTFASADEH